MFTAEAVSKGARSGTIRTPNGLLDVTLGNPLVKGIEKRGSNTELLFAGAYSACYNGALGNAAKKLGTPVEDSAVRTLVSLIEDDQGGYRLAVELHAQFPGIDRAPGSTHHGRSAQNLPLFQSLARRHCRQAGGGLTKRTEHEIAQWGGLPFKRLIEIVKPRREAKVVAFYSYARPSTMENITTRKPSKPLSRRDICLPCFCERYAQDEAACGVIAGIAQTLRLASVAGV